MTEIIILIILLILIGLCVHHYTKRPIYRDPLILRIKHDVSKLDERISRLDFYSSDESYTEDKNKIFLCLKDKDGNYYDYNMLIYVAIHECSHALTDVVDVEHVTPEFRGMFEYLLQKAYKLGLYNPEKPLVNNYCGINIEDDILQR